jgi:hypothetical protein
MLSAFGVEDPRISKADKTDRKAVREAAGIKPGFHPSNRHVGVPDRTGTPQYGGRVATGMVFPGVHGAVAGAPGHKLRATGNEVGGLTGGAVAGGALGALGHAVTRGHMPTTIAEHLVEAGALAGTAAGVQRAQRKGHYKPYKKAYVKPEADS